MTVEDLVSRQDFVSGFNGLAMNGRQGKYIRP